MRQNYNNLALHIDLKFSLIIIWFKEKILISPKIATELLLIDL